MLQVLTPSGWSQFKGIKKSNGSLISIEGLNCTSEHLIKIDNEFVRADSLEHRNLNITDYVYDLLGVELGNEYYTNSYISHNCNFRGSSNSLISGDVLERLVVKQYELKKNDLTIYEMPKEDHSYICVVDTAEGLGQDYHAAVIIDITEIPYNVVAVYHNNNLSSLMLPSLLFNIGKKYNDAFMLIEVHSTGHQVANDLYYDLEYESVFMTFTNKGKQTVSEFSSNGRIGVKTSKQVKSIGCNAIKTMIENDKISLNDPNIISEFGDFVASGGSYAAASGAHDDLAMTLVLFAWLTTQSLFKDLTSTDLKSKMIAMMMKQQEEDVMPFGIINDGHEIFDGSQNSPSNWY